MLQFILLVHLAVSELTVLVIYYWWVSEIFDVKAFESAAVCAVCGAVYVKTKDIVVVSNFFSFENYQVKEQARNVHS